LCKVKYNAGDMTANSDVTQKKPRGKGKPFTKNDPRINRSGPPRKGFSWREILDEIGDLDGKQALDRAGRIFNQLSKYPEGVTLKELSAISYYARMINDPSGSLLNAVRAGEDVTKDEGKQQHVSIPADLIAPDFLNVYRDIKDRKHTEYLLYGGRGSTKSSFISLAIIYLLVNNPGVHGLIARQVGNTLRDSVYSQLQWAINELGLMDSFRCTTSPMEITYLPTDQKLYFRGLDEPGKIKSITPVKGYIGIFWIEEADQAKSAEHVRKVEQSLRGGDYMIFFKSWNPPRSAQNWINKYIAIPKESQYQQRSNYLSVPREWLGEAWITEAEHLKAVNEKAYRNEYLGEVTGTGGQVFENLEVRKITDEEIKTFDYIYNGLDFGFTIDPSHYIKCSYNSQQRILYIYGELRRWKTSNQTLYNDLTEYGYDPGELLICDSAEPRSIADLRSFGANARGAEKSTMAVRYQMRWLENLTSIVIDPQRCPYTSEEFLNYEYARNNQEEYISEYVDANNHAIDSTRYALNLVINRKGS